MALISWNVNPIGSEIEVQVGLLEKITLPSCQCSWIGLGCGQ